MKLKIKRLTADARLPVRATSGAAGLDVTATRFEILPDCKIRYFTGIAVEIPEGYVGLAFARSSIFKMGVRLSNGVGVIDYDYRGELTAMFDIDCISPKLYNKGERIFQLVIVPIPEVELEEVDELSETERGAGGYGSTGC